MSQYAAYLRVSTPDQAGEDAYGLDAQRAAITAWAAQHGHTLAPTWYTDAGISGSTLERPGLQALLKDALVADWDGVIVAKLDRVARDLMLQLWIEKELLKAACPLISVAEPMAAEDPAGKLMRQIIGAFAEFEKARITERMAGGRLAKAKAGGYAGGGVPYGYIGIRGSKRLQVDPAQAEAVRALFALRDAHPRWSLRKLAHALAEAGYPTAQGKAWQPMTIARILDREPFYRGQYTYSQVEVEGQHPAIL